MKIESNKRKEVMIAISTIDKDRKKILQRLTDKIINVIVDECKSTKDGGLAEKAFIVEILRDSFWKNIK